jgi:two-component sensor histidine kinase
VHVSEAYSGDAGAIAAARALVVAFLGQVDAERLAPVTVTAIADAELVVSELVTNAVKYAPGPFRLGLELVDHALEITVWDGSPDIPATPPFDPTRIGRHGIEIVLAVCGALDVTRQESGKKISVRVPLQARVHP